MNAGIRGYFGWRPWIFTLEDLRQIFATKEDLGIFATKEDLGTFATQRDPEAIKSEMNDGFRKVLAKIEEVKEMLEEDAEAESGRLDTVSRRSTRTQKALKERISDASAHGSSRG
jgi:hypothetical protein